MEACGHDPWFERLLEELGFELWLADAAEVRASVVRKQKTDRRDAGHLLHLLLGKRVSKNWGPGLGVGGGGGLLGDRPKQGQGRGGTKKQPQGMGVGPGG